MLQFKIAFRNVLRQKRRTILTMLTMFGGFTLAAVSIGWSDGTYSYIIDTFTRNQLGHLQIHKGDYLDRPSIYKYIESYEKIGSMLEGIDWVEAWAPRLYAPGIASVEDKSTGVRIMGIDPLLEETATGMRKKLIEGRLFHTTGENEALLGSGLARILKASVGEKIVLVSQAADGSIANGIFTIAGKIETGDQLTDRMTLYIPLLKAQELLVLGGRAHEIIVIARDIGKVYQLQSEITKRIGDQRFKIEPWQLFASSFYRAMKADQRGMWISLLVIIIIVAVGVLNTVLMSVLERTREYGLLKALGSSPAGIIRLVIYEVNIMAAGSIIIGAFLSILINYVLSIHGVSYPEPFTYGGVEFSKMYTEVNLRSFIIPALTVAISAAIVAIAPAVRAGRTDPARAMRIH